MEIKLYKVFPNIINLRKCIIYLEVTKKKHNFAQILMKMLLFENNVT